MCVWTLKIKIMPTWFSLSVYFLVVIVVFEYKLRLEKSLQQEKAEHRKTHEELEERANGEKEANNKHSALQQQYKILQVSVCVLLYTFIIKKKKVID